MRLARVIAGITAVGACVAAALPFRAVFGAGLPVELLVSAAVGPLLVGFGCWAARVRSGWLQAACSALSWLLVATLLSPGGLSPSAAIGGVLRGWARLTTLPIPAPATPDLLVFVSGCLWLASAFALAGALAERPRPWTLVWPASLLVLSTALSVGSAAPTGSSVSWFVVFAVVYLMAAKLAVRHPLATEPGGGHGRPAMAWRPVLALVPVFAVLVGGAIAGFVPPGFDDADPVDPRAEIIGEGRVAEQPMNSLAPSLEVRPDDVVIRVIEGGEGLAFYRLNVLDRYDGTQWTSSSVYSEVGKELPVPAPGQAPTGRSRFVTIEVAADLDGNLPVPGYPTATDLADAQFDPTDGSLRADVAKRERYTIELVPMPDGRGATVSSAVRSPDPAEPELLGLPDAGGNAGTASTISLLQAVASRIASEATPIAGESSDVATLRSLQRFLSDGDLFGFEDDEPVNGHALRQLCDLIVGVGCEVPEDGEGTVRSGSFEQYASAYALLARMLGFPSRVAVGFQVEPKSGVQAVRRGDAAAWAEVRLEGLGWVPFVATPREADQPPEPGFEDSFVDTGAEAAPLGTPSNVPPIPKDEPQASGGYPLWALVGLGIVGCWVVLVLSGHLATELRRRRGRSLPGPSQRVVAAWLDLLAALDRAALRVTRAMSASAVADELEAIDVAQNRSHLVALVNRAQYSQSELDDADAVMAWSLSSGFRKNVRAAMPRRVRMWRAVSPRRSVRAISGRRTGTSPGGGTGSRSTIGGVGRRGKSDA